MYQIAGYNASDVLYWSNGITMIAQKYPFFLVTSAEDISKKGRLFPFPGVVGLSVDIDADSYLTLAVPFPVQLKMAGVISRAVAGINIRSDSYSTIDFGVIDTKKFRNKTQMNETDLQWITVPTYTTEPGWRTSMRSSWYNNTNFFGKSDDVLLDSFHSGIYLPLGEWIYLFAFI